MIGRSIYGVVVVVVVLCVGLLWLLWFCVWGCCGCYSSIYGGVILPILYSTETRKVCEASQSRVCSPRKF